MTSRIPFLIIGSSSSGKSTLIQHIISEEPSDIEPQKTIGMSYKNKKLDDNNLIEFFELSDGFPINQYSIYNRVKFIICVFDINNKDTFTFIKNVIEQIYLKINGFNRDNIFIIANKLDVDTNTRVCHEEIIDFIQNNQLKYSNFIQTSVKFFNPLSFLIDGLKPHIVKINPTETPDRICSVCEYVKHIFKKKYI